MIYICKTNNIDNGVDGKKYYKLFNIFVKSIIDCYKNMDFRCRYGCRIDYVEFTTTYGIKVSLLIVYVLYVASKMICYC